MLQKKWQNQIDKQRMLWYNNRRKVAKRKTDMNIITKLTESIDKSISKTTDENIRAIGDAIKQAREEGFPILRTPIIAGGAVRDYVFGLAPNDYDVFLDVSKIPKEEQEDAVMLFGLRVLDNLTEDENTKYLPLEDNTLIDITARSSYEGTLANIDPRWKDFVVFETGAFSERVGRMWHEEYGQDPAAANDKYRFLKIQFIGHNDERLSNENPLSFVEYFDYGLVRCLYDPEAREYALHPDFIETLEKKVEESDNERTVGRLQNFRSRFILNGKPAPFMIVARTRGKVTHQKYSMLEDLPCWQPAPLPF